MDSPTGTTYVIARDSASVYKDQPVPVRQIAEDLGVRYVLEGSIQQSGEDLRVTAQLIDAVSGFHIWSERYDRKLSDVFDVQDEITLNIVQELDVELRASSQAAVLSRQTESLEAWGLYVQAEQRWSVRDGDRASKADDADKFLERKTRTASAEETGGLSQSDG